MAYNLADLFEHAVDAGPDRMAVVVGERHLTFRELEYYKDPEKSAAAFVTVDGKRYAVSGDIALVEPDGTMTPFGRASQCINSGGEKIFPEEVEAALKSHPAVSVTPRPSGLAEAPI